MFDEMTKWDEMVHVDLRFCFLFHYKPVNEPMLLKSNDNCPEQISNDGHDRYCGLQIPRWTLTNTETYIKCGET